MHSNLQQLRSRAQCGMSNVAIWLAAEAHFHIWQRRIVPLTFNYWSQIQRFQYQTQWTSRHAPDPFHRSSHLLASVCIPMLVRKTRTRQNKGNENSTVHWKTGWTNEGQWVRQNTTVLWSWFIGLTMTTWLQAQQPSQGQQHSRGHRKPSNQDFITYTPNISTREPKSLYLT